MHHQNHPAMAAVTENNGWVRTVWQRLALRLFMDLAAIPFSMRLRGDYEQALREKDSQRDCQFGP